VNRVSKDQWPLPGTYYCPVCKGTNLTYNKYWKCNDCGYFFPNEPPKIRKNRHVPAGVIALLIILAVFFVLGLTYILLPSTVKATTKTKISTYFNNSKLASGAGAITTTTTQTLIGHFYVGSIFTGQYVDLRIVDEWDGTGNKTIDFNLPDPPAVLNFSTTTSNPLATDFNLNIQGPDIIPINNVMWETATNGMTLTGTGKYRLQVQGAGYNWKIYIGEQ
jgi:rubredoxin